MVKSTVSIYGYWKSHVSNFLTDPPVEMARANFGSWTPGQVTSASQIYVVSTCREIAKHEQLHIGISYFILLPHSQALTSFSSLAVQRAGWEPGNEWFMLMCWCTTSGRTSLASYPGPLRPPALCCTIICKWWKGVAWIEASRTGRGLVGPSLAAQKIVGEWM